ncbi:Dynamin-like 120 kDa protein, mitochondrial [Geodia barretti]|nr:Dynamin-like 120 kDa protein, mitochondrial [Geodia barretti]
MSREYFAKSKLFQNGMLREAQLSTRNMVNAVTEEFWKMVTASINDQALHFKTLRYNLEAEWRNRYPGGRTLDRNDLFELGKADILNHVASLQVFKPATWEGVLMDSLWTEVAPHVLEIFIEAAQGQSPGEFNTSADIQLHKWADSHQLAELCAKVGLETMFAQLHTKLEGEEGGGGGGVGGGGWGVVGVGGGGGKFHSLGQGLREEVERLSKQNHRWESYNVDQLKYVQMSALDDKDVPSAEQWRDAVTFMTSALSRQIKEAEDDLQKLAGPTSFYDRWVLWKSQSSTQVVKRAAAEELSKFLAAEPSHPSKLFTDELMTVQRVLKTQGHAASEEDIQESWRHLYHLHFLKRAEETAHKCQRGFVLRQHSPEYACPEVEYFWRVQQVMKSSSHTLRVQILDREVRQLEQQIKSILDSIAVSEERKKGLIRGDAVDKAEQLKQVRMIQEKLDTFREALAKQQKGHSPK